MNTRVKYEWKEHSSYSTWGEAKTKATRLEMLIGKPSMIWQNPMTKKYWILLGYHPVKEQINKTLE